MFFCQEIGFNARTSAEKIHFNPSDNSSGVWRWLQKPIHILKPVAYRTVWPNTSYFPFPALLLRVQRQACLNPSQWQNLIFSGHCSFIIVYSATLAETVRGKRAIVSMTVDYWSTGWDGGRVGRLIVVTYCMLSFHSLISLFHSLSSVQKQTGFIFLQSCISCPMWECVYSDPVWTVCLS